MRRVASLVLFLMLIAPSGLADDAASQQVSAAMTLDQALALAPERDVAVLDARGDLEAARRDDQRMSADPLALKVPTLQARQAVTLAEETLAAATLAARLAVMTAYHDALEAQDAVALDESRVALARMSLDAASIRLTAGAASTLDVERATNDLAGAERSATASRRTAALALQRLAARVGVGGTTLELTEPSAPAPLPALLDMLARSDENAGVKAAQRALSLARAQLEAVDNPYTARADVEVALDAVAAAERALEDTRVRLELSLRQAHNAAAAAQGSLRTAEDALGAAQADAEAQQIRFGAGSISRLELEQARLGRDQAAAQVRAARHDVAVARMQLEQVVLGGGR